jgi:Flp pilus assembly protein TadG
MFLKKSRRGQRGSLLVLTTIAVPVFIVPLVGLGIDATICYIVQAELSAAVDGAALGTGRLLSTNATPSDIANEFLNANFRVGQGGFWSAYNLNSTINVATGTTKTVTITATADVPLLFMRILHQDHTTVAATAQATRRDARIELVIDRSGSMNTSDGAGSTVIADVVSYAQGFTQQFTEGYDEMGLVVFSGSAVVGYPNTSWPASTSPTGTGGPDSSFQNGNAGTSTNPDMVNQIAAVTAGGGTAMGDALALAYIELQKAHMRDLTANGADTRTNAIVLFTDGVPSSVATYLNRNVSGNSIVSSSAGCTYRLDAATPTNPMYGYVVLGGSPPYTGSPLGFYYLASLDSSHSSKYYMSAPSADFVQPSSWPYTSNTNLCSSSGWSSMGNITALPTKDKYGYSLAQNGSVGYLASSIVNGSTTSIYRTGSGYGGFNANATSNLGYQWGLAGWDEVDNVAEAIRSDSNYSNRTGDTAPMSITIYTVGYTGNGGTDRGLLSKVANIQACTFNGYSCYNNAQPAGLYIEASDKTALANAFSAIATAILRLAR